MSRRKTAASVSPDWQECKANVLQILELIRREHFKGESLEETIARCFAEDALGTFVESVSNGERASLDASAFRRLMREEIFRLMGQAESHHAAGQPQAAWNCLIATAYMAGSEWGKDHSFENRRAVLSDMARRAANARHKPSRERKAKIEAWYANNRSKYRSMDGAAEAATKVFGVSFRTARKHIGEARKRLPNARKA